MMKKLRVTVEGKTYDVTVELLGDAVSGHPSGHAAPAGVQPPPPLPAPTAPAARLSSGEATGDVPSPLAGRVAALNVQVGQSVQEGDQLAVIEAMKMNTHVLSPTSGMVRRVLVQPGDQVEEGQALVTVE